MGCRHFLPTARNQLSRSEFTANAPDASSARTRESPASNSLRKASGQRAGDGGLEELRRLTVPASVEMVNILGPRDEFLHILERELEAGIHVRGNEITLTGSPAAVDLAIDVITELVTVLRTGQGLTADAVERICSMLAGREETRPADVLTHNILSARGKTIRPKTLNQKRYVDAIDKHTVVFSIGPAGTGKTYLAIAKAVQALQNKQVNRIILTRPAVEAGEHLGFLPGTLSDKIDPYLRPLYDALHDMLDPDSIPRLLTAGTIEVAPLAYMRGRTLNDAFIISGRGAEHLDGTDEDVPDPAGLRLQDGRHRGHHPGRSARWHAQWSAGCARHSGQGRRHRVLQPHQSRCGAAQAGGPDCCGVRQVRGRSC